jgi:curved DNA-binding protein CbpA
MSSSQAASHVNWYDILGIPLESTKEHIGKAARKLALKFHPDRNADPKAKEIFLKIQMAKDFLLDEGKRKELDDSLLASKKRKEHDARKNQQMDGKRRKMKSDLEQKVNLARGGDHGSSTLGTTSDGKEDHTSSKVSHASKINHLRKEGLSRMEATAKEQQAKEERRMRDMEVDKYVSSLKDNQFRVRLKWRSKDESHSDESLYQLFKQFGAIEEVHILAGKGNQAVVSFTNATDASAAVDAYVTSEVMRVVSLQDPAAKKRAAVFTHQYSSSSSVPSVSELPRADSGGLSGLEQEMRRAVEREQLLKSLGKEDSHVLFGGNIPAAAGLSIDASHDRGEWKPAVVAPVLDMKAKENDILARMKLLAAQKKQNNAQTSSSSAS